MKIGNREYSKKELLRRIGNTGQLCGTRHYELTEGRARGIRAVDFNTGGGLCFTVLPDRGLDISLASYKGRNLTYLTPNGEVHPAFYESRGSEWLRIFFGGLLTTCGLTHIGAPGKDGEEDLGLHGRYAAAPARQVRDNSRWEGDEYRLELEGVVEECSLFGPKLRLTRIISSITGLKSLVIRDRIENFGYSTSPFTILYHINPGFPLLGDQARLLVSAKSVEPYNAHAEKNLAEHKKFGPPQAGFVEQNYLHKMGADKEGLGYAALINPELDGGLGLYLKYSTDTLPYLSEWKMLGEGDYVVGIEPCNTQVLNRAVLREKKMLPSLAPGEVRETRVEIGILEGEEEIEAFKRRVERIINA